MSRKRKSGKQDDASSKIILISAILNLIQALLDLVNKLLEGKGWEGINPLLTKRITQKRLIVKRRHDGEFSRCAQALGLRA